MLKQIQVTKYLDLLSNINTNRKKINYSNTRRSRYLQKHEETSNSEQVGEYDEQSAFIPILPKKSMKRRRRQNVEITSYHSDGEIVNKAEERHNLYQIYCQSLRKKRNETHKQFQKEKKQRNKSVNDIFDKIKLEDKLQSPSYTHIPKSKSFRASHEHPHHPSKRNLTTTRRINPDELNIGPISSLRMPKIEQKYSNNQFTNSLKLDKLSTNLRKVKANRQRLDRLAHKLQGWQTNYQDQSIAAIYFHI